MTKHSKLIYALKDGNIVSIDDVPSGKECGCVCPACGDELIARKGQKRMHHFAHRSNEDCEYGYESSLHLAAKDILSRSEKMVIPPVYVEFPQSSKSKQLLYLEKKISHKPAPVLHAANNNAQVYSMYLGDNIHAKIPSLFHKMQYLIQNGYHGVSLNKESKSLVWEKQTAARNNSLSFGYMLKDKAASF